MLRSVRFLSSAAAVVLTVIVGLAVALLLVGCGGGDGGESDDLTDRLVLERDEGVGLLDLATGEEELLIPNPPDVFIVDPAVSPDRERLAYAYRLAQFVDDSGQPPDLGADLYVSSIDGSEPELLVEHSEANEELRSPVWHPDGQFILYARLGLERRQGQVFVIKSIERYDFATGETSVVVESGFQPTVCSDGERMVYINDDNLVYTLWISDIDGSNAEQVAGADEGFSWFNSPKLSPDCETLAFGGAPLPEEQTSREPLRFASLQVPGLASASRAAAAYNGLPEDIWVMDVASRELTNLCDIDLDLPNLAWSGDGQRIFVLSGQALFVADIDGGCREVGPGTFHGRVDWLDDGSAAAPTP